MSSKPPHPRIEARHLNPEMLPDYFPDPDTNAHLVEPVLAAINAAVADCSVVAASTIAGRTYTNDHDVVMVTDLTDTAPSSTENFVLQVTIVVPYFGARPVHDAIDVIKAKKDNALLRQAELELAEAQASVASAQEEVARRQAHVNRLMGAITNNFTKG